MGETRASSAGSVADQRSRVAWLVLAGARVEYEKLTFTGQPLPQEGVCAEWQGPPKWTGFRGGTAHDFGCPLPDATLTPRGAVTRAAALHRFPQTPRAPLATEAAKCGRDLGDSTSLSFWE